MTTAFSFILTNNSSNGFYSNADTESSLLSNNTDNCGSILTMDNDSNGFDAFGGKDIFGSCDLSNTNESLFANASSAETAGSVAYSTAETAGSIACATAETAGSIACSSAETAGSVACGASAGSDSGSCGGGSFSSMC